MNGDLLDQVGQNYLSTTSARAITALDANPDDAARVMQFSSATGIPEQIVAGDPDGFERNHRASLLTRMLNDNPQLRDYVNANPMHAAVSNDDWGNLDTLSRQATQLMINLKALRSDETWAEMARNPAHSMWQRVGAATVEEGRRIALNAWNAFTVFGDVASGKASMADPETQQRVMDAGQWFGARPTPGGPFGLGTSVEHGGIWTGASKDPPTGLTPQIDGGKAELNKARLEEMEMFLQGRDRSGTWERSPESFRAFLRQHVGDETIGVEGRAVAALYGDKPPAPGDGLLGDIPGIENKIATALKTGGDVQIPLVDVFSRLDPEVSKALAPGIRAWPGGLTALEDAEPKEYLPPVDPSPVSQVRAPAGLEPIPDHVWGADVLKRVEAAEEPVATPPMTLPKPEASGTLGAGGVEGPKPVELEEQLKAEALGLDIKSFRAIQDAVRERHEADLAAALKRTEIEQAKKQTAEWKANHAEMAKDAAAELRQRPDVASDLFIGAGEVTDAEGKVHKLQQRFTLREGDLTPEQIASLPAHYVSKNGLPIDSVAEFLGLGSGRELVDHLAGIALEKEGRSPREHLDHLATTLADQRMEIKYGALPENILSEAQAQAVNKAGLNVLIQEYYGAAIKAGQAPIDANLIRQEARDTVAKTPIGELSFQKTMDDIGKAYRTAVRALAGGDPVTAVQALQQRTLNGFLAREIKAANAKVASLEKKFTTWSRWRKPEKNEVKTIEPEYLNWMHSIMKAVGKKVSRSSQNIADDIAARPEKTLQDFVNAKADALRELPVWDQLFDASWAKPFDQLTFEEFTALDGSLRALEHNGKEELKVYRAGEAADKDKVRAEIKENLKAWRDKPIELRIDGRRADLAGRLLRAPRTFIAECSQIETLANIWDHFDPKGPMNQYVMRDLIDSANRVEQVEKDYTKVLREAFKLYPANLREEVPNPLFRQPLGEGKFGETFIMERANLRMVLLNAGNSRGARSNLWKLAKGFGVEPEAVMDWLKANATKVDWDWAQHIWDHVWEHLYQEGANTYRNITGGVAPEKLPLDPIETPHGVYAGGYTPMDPHPVFKAKGIKIGKDSLAQSNFTSTLPSASWAHERTGAAYPVSLEMDRLPLLIRRTVWDVQMREALINASKILLDDGVQNHVGNYIGKEYQNLLQPYLVGLANRANYITTNQAYANSLTEKLRRNLVGGLVSLGTVTKHAPTALVSSMTETGPLNVLRGAQGMFKINPETGERNFQLTQQSLELARRDRNWEETMFGELLKQTRGTGKETLQQNIAKFASKPVAFSDMLSARTQWLGEYLKQTEAGATDKDAFYMADRAVRRAHGSTALTNRPAIMRDYNPWLSTFYTFFNDFLNRQMELTWRAGEMLKLAKEGERGAAMRMAPYIAGGVFAYAVWPAIVEELVSPTEKKGEHPAPAVKALEGLAYTESSMFPVARDIAHAAIHGTDPEFGMGASAMKAVTDFVRDTTKKEPLNRNHAERLVRDSLGLTQLLTGVVPQPLQAAAEFGTGIAQGVEHPPGPWGWLVGLRYGTLKGHSSSLGNWWQGRGY